MTSAITPATRALPEAAAWLATVAVAADGTPGWHAASAHRPADIHPAEWLEAEVLTDPARRRQWLAGRRAAKLALARLLGDEDFEPALHAIRSRDRFGHPTRPTVWRAGRRLDVHVSLAHGDRLAAAIASLVHRVGVDVVDAAVPGHDGDREPWVFSAREAAYKVGAIATRDEPFRPDEWRVERAAAQPHGTVSHHRLRGHALPVRWLGDVPGAPVLAVSWNRDERSAA
ncbi:MAG: hypothetical protein IPK07_10680 [Deltaproteobacteria bacterium]|nr:hypothetical protein [Deltaproteobacteria bacterium]